VRRVAVLLGRIAVVLAIVGGLLYVGAQLRWPTEKPIGYWAIDARTLQVVLLDSPNLGCSIARVDEASNAVHIHAQCGERVVPVPQTGMAQQYVFQVTLQADLAGRTVYDGSGNAAQSCQKPVPDCWYSG
jgi:hypothetical protein